MLRFVSNRTEQAGGRLIEIRRTFDYDLVSEIANRQENYRITRDDFSPPMGEFQAARTDKIYYLMALDIKNDNEQEILGFGAFIPQNAVCFDAHICFLPCAYGRTEQSCRAMFEWLWKRTDCRKITGAIARYNRLAIALARRCGMKIEGVNFASFLKDGKLHDQVLLGISKPCHS